MVIAVPVRPALFLLRFAVLLSLSAVAARAEYPFAAGTDRSGRARAVSDAEGRVLIESPEFPRGVWVDVVGGAGQALAGIQVEYEGLPDSLVALRCVDPSGLRQETLLWTRPGDGPLRLALKPGEPAGLPAGMSFFHWRIDEGAEALLDPVETGRLSGWEELLEYLQDRWQGKDGPVVVGFEAGTALAIRADHPAAAEMVAYLQRLPLEGADASEDAGAAPLEVQVYKGGTGVLESVVISFSWFEDEAIETAVRHALGKPEVRLGAEEIASITTLFALNSNVRSLSGLERLKSLERLELDDNEIDDLAPLAGLSRLRTLVVRNNRIADLVPLAALSNLEILMLTYNDISDVTPLASLTNLQWLCLTASVPAEKWIVDLKPLASLTGLERLWLSGNRIVDLTPLGNLTNLSTLWLSNNQIQDISPLVANTGLDAGDRVNLAGNPLSDRALNEQIPALRARGVSVITTN